MSDDPNQPYDPELNPYPINSYLYNELSNLKPNQFLIIGHLTLGPTYFDSFVYNPYASTLVNYHDAFNVRVGDWISIDSTGQAWQISRLIDNTLYSENIYATSPTIFYAVIDDVDNYNAGIIQSYGYGGPRTLTGTAFLFETDDYNNPTIAGLLLSSSGNDNITAIVGRFSDMNSKRKYISINQPGHTLQVNDAIYINTSTKKFAKSRQDKVSFTIGIVTTIGIPTADDFTFNAFGEFRDSYKLDFLGANRKIVGRIFYINPNTGSGTFLSSAPASYPFPVYQIINTNGDAILLKGIGYGTTGGGGGGGGGDVTYYPRLTVDDFIVSSISGVDGNRIVFTSPFYASDANISTISAYRIYSGSIMATDITASNMFSGSIVATDITASNMFSGSIVATDITVSNIFAGLIVATDATITNLKTDTAYISTITAFNIFAGSFVATDATITNLKATTAYISTLTSYEIITGKISSTESYVSTSYANGLWLQGNATTTYGLLYADSSMTLYWNGNQLVGKKDDALTGLSSFKYLETSTLVVSSITLLPSGGILYADNDFNLYWNNKPIGTAGSTFINLYADNLFASTINVSSLSGYDIITGKISGSKGGPIIFKNTFYASDAYISTITAYNIFTRSISATDAAITDLKATTAYISTLTSYEIITEKISSTESYVSTSYANGLWLQGNATTTYGLLYADSSMTLYWNGNQLVGKKDDALTGVSSFKYLETSTLVVSSITLLPSGGILYADNDFNLYWNNKPIGTAGSTFVNLYADNLFASTINVSSLSGYDIVTGKISGSKGNPIIFKNTFYASDAYISTITSYRIFSGSIVATDAAIADLKAERAYISSLTAYEIVTGKISSTESYVSSSYANALWLQGNATTTYGLLYADSSMTLYWNGNQLTGIKSEQSAGVSSFNYLETSTLVVSSITLLPSGGILYADNDFNLYWNNKPIGTAGSTFVNLYADNLFASTINVSSLTGNDIITGRLSGSKGGPIIFKNTFYASDAYISTLTSYRIFSGSIVATDAAITNLKTDTAYISTLTSYEIVTGKISSTESYVSSSYANGIWLQGNATTTYGLLYADSSMTLYWNGNQLIGAKDDAVTGLSSFKYLETSTLVVSSITLLPSGGILYADNDFNLYWNNKPIGSGGTAGSTFVNLYADNLFASTINVSSLTGNDIITGRLSGSKGGPIIFKNTFYASDGYISTLTAYRISSGSIVATDATITNLKADTAYISTLTSYEIVTGKISSTESYVSSSYANGIWLQGNATTTYGLLYADSSMTLYWNGNQLIGAKDDAVTGLSSFKYLETSTLVVSSITLLPSGGILYADNDFNLYWNNKPIGSGGTAGSTFVNLYADNLFASTINVSSLTSNEIVTGKLSGSKGNPIIFKNTFYASDGYISTLTAYRIFSGSIVATDAAITNLKTDTAYISTLTSYEIVTGKISSTESYVSSSYANALWLQGNATTTYGLLYADSSMTLYWNGNQLIGAKDDTVTGLSSFNYLETSTLVVSSITLLPSGGILYADNDFNLYWNNKPIGSGGTAGSTFVNLYADNLFASTINVSSLTSNEIVTGKLRGSKGAPIIFTNPFYASDAYISTVTSYRIFSGSIVASDATMANLKADTAYISTITSGKISSTESYISTSYANGIWLQGNATTTYGLLYADSSMTLYWNGNQLIGANGDQAAGLSSFNYVETSTLVVSSITLLPSGGILYADNDFNLYWNNKPIGSGGTAGSTFTNLYADNVFASTINVSSLTSKEIVTEKLSSIEIYVSSSYANGLWLQGNETTTYGLLYADSSMTLYWNGNQLTSTKGDQSAGLSSFNYLETSTLLVSSITLLPSGGILYADNEFNLYWNNKPIGSGGTAGSTFVNLYADNIFSSTLNVSKLYTDNIFSSTINVSTIYASDAYVNTIYASDAITINCIRANYIGSEDSILFFFSDFSSRTGYVSTLATSGIKMEARNSTISSILYADSSLTLYWNDEKIIGPSIPFASAILTDSTEIEEKLLLFKMVRVNLDTTTGAVIKLPTGTELMHIRIYNKGSSTIDVNDDADTLVQTIASEVASFVYQGTEWIYFPSF